MKILLTLITLTGILFLPGPMVVPTTALEPGEVEINTPTLPSVADVLGNFTPGINEVEIRGLNLTPSEVNNAFLSTDSTQNTLVQIGSQLSPGQQVDFRTVDGQRFRVENEEGQLRVRLRDVTLNENDRAALASFFSPTFGRVEIRGVDADTGNRIRIEVRDGAVRRDEVRADRSGRGREGTSASINNERGRDRGRDLDHSIRGRDRAALERERNERPERLERVERGERVDRSGRSERIERLDRSGRH